MKWHIHLSGGGQSRGFMSDGRLKEQNAVQKSKKNRMEQNRYLLLFSFTIHIGNDANITAAFSNKNPSGGKETLMESPLTTSHSLGKRSLRSILSPKDL